MKWNKQNWLFLHSVTVSTENFLQYSALNLFTLSSLHNIYQRGSDHWHQQFSNETPTEYWALSKQIESYRVIEKNKRENLPKLIWCMQMWSMRSKYAHKYWYLYLLKRSTLSHTIGAYAYRKSPHICAKIALHKTEGTYEIHKIDLQSNRMFRAFKQSNSLNKIESQKKKLPVLSIDFILAYSTWKQKKFG